MPSDAKDRFDLARRLERRARRGARYRRGLRTMAIAGWETTKEHNVGSLIRTAHAAAAAEVLLVGDREWNVPAAKTAQDFTDIRFLEDEEDFLRYIRHQGYSLVAVELHESAVSLFEARYPEKPCFLVGAERKGIPASLLDAAELIVEIPQWGLVPCLNLAIAGSIVLYDYLGKQAQEGVLDRPGGGLVADMSQD